ncbi:DUF72 domain-containing protein [Bacteroidetes/Chlorobi group bacterium Naka2016]|jgi:uncharacterized protein YecE (DUF72 family)|nr:MAG: DUF72 domain-containing protein [Bacteroidetes/Chlorobi group bacterium Naka2016]
MNIYIGTSGWAFPNWVGILYPEGLPQNKWLNYYSQVFNCVEVNSTFYRLFKPATYTNWLRNVGENFKFIIKIPQEISHKKKLVGVRKDLDDFFDNIEVLKQKIGMLLLQLPPSFNTPLDIFANEIMYIRSKYPLAVEFRNYYSKNDDVLGILIEQDCTFVNPDSPQFSLTNIITNRTVYFRLHGRIALHKSSYDDDELKDLAEKVYELESKIDNCYVIFNNGMLGYSIPNALKLQTMLGLTNNDFDKVSGQTQTLDF